MKYCLGVFAAIACVNLHAAEWRPAAGHQELPIWPGAVPNARPATGPEGGVTLRTDRPVAGQPWLEVENVPGHMSVNYKADLSRLNPTIRVTPQTPPTFLLHAQDDPIDPVEFSLLYHAALMKENVPVEMHLFAQGGHAFGLRPNGFPIKKWPALVETWLGTIGMIPSTVR